MKKSLFLISAFLTPIMVSAYVPGRPLNQHAAHHVSMAVGHQQAAAAPIDMSPLPVRLLRRDPEWEMIVRSGTTTPSLPDLQNCQMMFSGMAETVWGDSDAPGLIRENSCLTVVQLRTMGANAHQVSQNDRVLAVAHVPTGSHFNCNIDSFPQSGFTAHVMEVEFPPDAPPTEEQVLEVLNQEQRANAGMRTGIAALAGGAAMFMLNQGDTGDRVRSAAIGAAGAGGLTFATTRMDYVAGQTVMAAGVNAATGAVVGNIAAGMYGGGQRILVLEDCLDSQGNKTGQQCLWGSVQVGGQNLRDRNSAANVPTPGLPACDAEATVTNCCLGPCYYEPHSRTTVCANPDEENTFRRQHGLTVNRVAGLQASTTNTDQWNIVLAELLRQGSVPTTNHPSGFSRPERATRCLIERDGIFHIDDTACPTGTNNRFIPLAGNDAACGVSRQNAMIRGINLQAGFIGNIRGIREQGSNWQEAGGELVARTTDGRENSGELSWEGWNDGTRQNRIRESFTPLTMGAEDGDVLDFQNQARAGATLAGAGAGAALGGLSARTEALTAVQIRLIEETERYEALTRRFYCISGTRFLSDYNMPVIIPQLPTF